MPQTIISAGALATIGGLTAKSLLEDAAAAIDQASENASIRFSNVGQDLLA